MRTLLTLSMIVLLCTGSPAQDRYYKYFYGNATIEAATAAVSNDSAVFLAGIIYEPAHRGKIARVNKHGMLDWSKRLGGAPNQNVDLWRSCALEDRIYLTGTFADVGFVACLDAKTGLCHWAWSGDPFVGSKGVITTDGHFIYTVFSEWSADSIGNYDYRPMLIKTDTAGAVVWSKRLAVTDVCALVYEPNTNALCMMSNDTAGTVLTLTDTSGAVTASWRYHSLFGEQLTRTGPGRYTIIGKMNQYVVAAGVTAGGQLRWATAITDTASSFSSNIHCAASDGSGNTLFSTYDYPGILKLDSLGQLSWSKNYYNQLAGVLISPTGLVVYGQHVVLATDANGQVGGCTLVGVQTLHDSAVVINVVPAFVTSSPVPLNRTNRQVVLTDQPMLQAFNCTVGIAETAAAFGVTLYPNPANDVISFDRALSPASFLELYSPTGAVVKLTVAADGQFHPDLPAGLYLYRLMDGEEILAAGKLSIVH